MEVAEDPDITALGKSLAERASALGRFYAIAPIKLEDRARFLKAASGVTGLKVSVEGDGRSRRVVFSPDKPTPMPHRTLPVHDDEA
jgi:predicted RNA-binding protein Jag